MHRIPFAVSVAIIVGFLVVGPVTAQEPALPVDRTRPKVKLLKCRAFVASYNSFMSPGGEWAVIYESGPENSQRLALWDLKRGKLVRFLSAEKDKETKEFAGVDDADFGAKIAQRGSQAFTFSPDGKLAATSVDDTVKIWELASGKLLHEVKGSRFHHDTFRFVDERRIVGKSNRGSVIESIDARIGEKRKLMGPVRFESYGGAVLPETFTLVSVSEVFALSLQNGERTRLADVSPTSRAAPSRTWYSQDATTLYIQREEMVQVLDVSSGKYTNILEVFAPKEEYRIEALATKANLLAVGRPERVDLWDASLGAVRTTLTLPFKSGNIGGISQDGSKLLLAQDGQGAVVLDFGGSPPAAIIDVARLIAEQAPVPAR